MNWRFLDTGLGNAAFNMGVDEALLEGVRDGTSPPTLRTYVFSPPAFSIGYLQDLTRQIDPAICARHGIGWVRRPTGGRTVLHGWDLTYSVIASIDDLVPGGTITDAYKAVSGALVGGLRLLGVGAEFERPRRNEPREKIAKPCFTSISRYEVSCGGRKIIGSAQRVVGRYLLQHGSLPLSDPPHGPHEFVPGLGSEERARLGAELAARSTSLAQELGRPVSAAEAADALGRALEASLGRRLEPAGLSGRETARANSLMKDKYESSDWNERGPLGLSRTEERGEAQNHAHRAQKPLDMF
jgi:lipoate-protein ligase A